MNLNRGFTLIELTISTAIAAIVLVASYLCLSAGLASQKMIEPRVEVLQTARVALAMMTSDLRSACPLSADVNLVGQPGPSGRIEADDLNLATHYHTPKHTGEGDYCQISYYADQDDKSGQYNLYRRRYPVLMTTNKITADGSREKIATGLRGLEFDYFDGDLWHDHSWGDPETDRKLQNRTQVESNLFGMPEAVRITLMLDSNPAKKAAAAPADEKPEPPLVFQTVVKLELTDATPAAGLSDSATASGPGNGAPAQNNGNGGRN